MTIREPDGTEHRMCRWTNPIPWFINHIRFINKDPKHLAEYMTQWNGMREDWEHHLTVCKKEKHISCCGDNCCKFNFPMTPCYAPYPVLAPIDYGLILVDMQKDVILSCQGYSYPGNMHRGKYISNDKDWQITQDLWDAGKVKSIENFGKPVKMPKNLDKIKKGNVVTFKLDLSPFKIILVEEGDYETLKKEVLRLGFKLSPEEEKMWEEAIKEEEWE